MSYLFGGGGSSNPFASGGTTVNVIPKSNGSSQLQDSQLLAPTANTLRLANLANVQTLEIYGTTDSNSTPVNFERLTILPVSGNAYKIFSEKGGTGTLRGIDLLCGAGNNVSIGASGRTFIVAGTAGNIILYKGLTTAGIGVPAVYAAARSVAQTAAVASVATFTPAVDASLIVSANVLVTTATSHAFQVTCSYTDEGNTARTAQLNFANVAGSLVTTIGNAGGAVPYMGIPQQIRVKASTAVTIATSGTFTTVTYNVEGTIQQVN